MPAITVEDLSTLPVVAVPAASAARLRRARSVTSAVNGFEGDGFPVRRGFAGVPFEVLDPFVLLDQVGEVDYSPGEPKGTPWHPHRGFETVTYLIDGETEHHDSTGGGGLIANGDTQWMTAGAGILHIERPPEHLVRSGGLFHGVQLWVNLPAAQKFVPPRYQDIRADRSVLLTSPDGGALVRVIAGAVAGVLGPGVTRTPIALVHATLAPSSQLVLPWPESYNALVYVLAGRGDVGAERRPVRSGQLAVLTGGDAVAVQADPAQEGPAPSMEVLVLGGEPIREPVVQYGPFVMNTERQIREAFADYRSGRLGSIPASR